MTAFGYSHLVCRNITELRGLDPPATGDEIEAAARQFLRKVSGMRKPSKDSSEAFEEAVTKVSEVTSQLLSALPPRMRPPAKEPPLRRRRTEVASA